MFITENPPTTTQPTTPSINEITNTNTSKN